MSDCEAIALHQSVCYSIRSTSGSAQKSFVDAPEAVNKILLSIVSYSKRSYLVSQNHLRRIPQIVANKELVLELLLKVGLLQ